MNTRSRSTLFLIEQLIVIAVFAMCAAACARILTAAYFNAIDSRDINNAILYAENGAESFKTTSGDLGTVAEIMGGFFTSSNTGGNVTVFFDNRWQVSSEVDARYILLLESRNADAALPNLVTGDLSVERSNGDKLISFPVAARVG